MFFVEQLFTLRRSCGDCGHDVWEEVWNPVDSALDDMVLLMNYKCFANLLHFLWEKNDHRRHDPVNPKSAVVRVHH